MLMRPQRYIGITGFMSREEVDGVLSVLSDERETLVMIGGLVSAKTLQDGQSKWPKRYPEPNTLGKIFPSYRNVLNLIHFNTRNQDRLLFDMNWTQDLAGPNCHGFQLNIAWPDKKVLEQYKKGSMFRNKTIVLQCGAKAMKEAGSPFNVGMRLRDYEGLVDYVLIDPSGGLGKEFNPEDARAAFYYIRENARDSNAIGLGIAGGLHAGNLGNLQSMLPDFEFSIDAEGKLRDGNDNLDIAAAQAYLRAADALFRQYKKMA